MLGDKVTLYFPGDGVRENSNTATYKGIKDFRDNGNGTITFKTKKHGEITSPLPWRLCKGVDLGADENEHDNAPGAPAGNMANKPKRGW